MKTTLFAAAAALAFATPALAHNGIVHDGCAAGPVTAGDLTLSGAFTRALLPNAKAGGAFLLIENNGTEDDRLIGAETEAAARTEIHEMKIVDDIMKMQELAEGLVVPAGGTVTLAPGGFHVMLMGIDTPFVEGECLELTLTFERAGSVDVVVPVGPVGAASAPDEMHHDMDHHAHD